VAVVTGLNQYLAGDLHLSRDRKLYKCVRVCDDVDVELLKHSASCYASWM